MWVGIREATGLARPRGVFPYGPSSPGQTTMQMSSIPARTASLTTRLRTELSLPCWSTSVCMGRLRCARPAAVITAFPTCISHRPFPVAHHGPSFLCARRSISGHRLANYLGWTSVYILPLLRAKPNRSSTPTYSPLGQLIIEGHGTTHIVIPQSAQIGDFVVGLCYRIAGVSKPEQSSSPTVARNSGSVEVCSYLVYLQ
jgi:hypothetical protein